MPSELLAGRADDEHAERLAAAAEGNPLFIEELAAVVAERSGDVDALPTTIRSILAARLDALEPDERAILLDAAVVGKIFWRGVLERIERRSDGLGVLLGALEERGLIRREAVSRIQGDEQYTFKHGLLRQVAYATVPRARRRERHAAVAALARGDDDGDGGVGGNTRLPLARGRRRGPRTVVLPRGRGLRRSWLGKGTRGRPVQRCVQAPARRRRAPA